MSPLGRDAVEIHRAGRAEEFDAAVFDVLDAVDAIGVGNDARQNGLPFDQRQTAQVAPIELEHIKRHVVGPVGTKQQMVDSTATVGAETDDSPSSTASVQRTECASSVHRCGHDVRT